MHLQTDHQFWLLVCRAPLLSSITTFGISENVNRRHLSSGRDLDATKLLSKLHVSFLDRKIWSAFTQIRYQGYEGKMPQMWR